MSTSSTWTERARNTASGLPAAGRELLAQEFDRSPGHLTALFNGCVFAPSILTFWFVNGIADFSTAIALGTVASPGGLQLRLLAYLLAVPVFLGLRAGFYVAHPVHRQAIRAGTCPRSDLFSLDWFTVGILVTGLPLAFEDLGLWIAMNAIFAAGIFGLPRFLPDGRRSIAVKAAALATGGALFVYAKVGGAVAARLAAIPEPTTVLGPVATLSLGPGHLDLLLAITNSLVLGPPVVALVALAMNWLLTHPEVRSIPVLRHTVPHRDPRQTVVVSAAVGTVFYLLFVAAFSGRVIVLP